MYSYVHSQITAASDWPRLFCTLGVFCLASRLTVVSREAKKKQHACAYSGPRDHYSELFTRMAALKF